MNNPQDNMSFVKKLFYLLIGVDKWVEKTHDNKNILTAELVKTDSKLEKVNRMPYYRKDRIYLFGKTMGTIK